jgi:hypothetical protein
MKTIAKIGLVTVAVGVAMAGSLTLQAAEQLDNWKVRGLTRPGAWFEKYNTEKATTIAVNKSGRGVGAQKSIAPKKRPKHVQ